MSSEENDENTNTELEEKKEVDQMNETSQTQKFDNYLKENAERFRILNLGCGNSILPEEMHDIDKYTSITNIDIS